MKDLIAKLEKAEAGSRELDAEITEAVYLSNIKTWDGKNVTDWFLHDDGEFFGCHTADGWQHSSIVRILNHTTSIDAALSLVPEGWRVYCLQDARHFQRDQGWTCGVDEKFGPNHALVQEARTPALALCIAALKARRAL